MNALPYLLLTGLLALGTGCSRSQSSDSASKSTNLAAKAYPVRGVVQELKPDGLTAKIQHEAIKDYMEAMTMDFEAKQTNVWAGIKPGDLIEFSLWVTENDGWVDSVRKVGVDANFKKPQALLDPGQVDEFEVGDLVPNLTFTNQFNQPFELASLRGQAVAFTFIFTSCPFPTYCPLISHNFTEVQSEMKKSGYTNWHLISLTFDLERDTPNVLAGYARRQMYDSNYWTFATLSKTNLEFLAAKTGLLFARDTNGFSHNLRTVVISPEGKVTKIFPNNLWRASNLVEALKATLTPAK